MSSLSQPNPAPIPVLDGNTDLVSRTIAVPRWVVYFQAALLGLVATTFFIFGLIITSRYKGAIAKVSDLYQC